MCLTSAGGDIWKMLTDPVEREKLECVSNCMKDGKIEPLCVVGKCTKAAATCLLDSTCRHAATCPAKAMMHCSASAFRCVFSRSGVCRDNLKCLGNGVVQCGASGVNLFTDSKIADVVSCAGSKCPHPAAPKQLEGSESTALESHREPHSAAGQLLCVAEKCTRKVLKIVADQDTRDLVTCALKGEMGDTCPAVWKCLGATLNIFTFFAGF
eukprot:TRINITY_DN10617_c0_g1_i4.p1 TRINITY_DN10617_c0_g1~~TRINITY_DN10617_c0_g1_i4.p1  ORF type:complete len:211 (+),score=22.29 TRINITY_DN10617_c0_g1_i4:329-961(+)